MPVRKSVGGTRYYSANQLLGQKTGDLPTVCYARVSSHDQKGDLERQASLLGELLHLLMVGPLW